MPPAVIHRKERPATADRRRVAAVALLVALQLAAAGLLIWSEADLAARVAFALTWGLLNFFWLVLLRRPLDGGGAVPWADRHSHPVVAVQARRPDDDGDVRRCDDHRPRHLFLSPGDHSRPRLEGGPRPDAGDPRAARGVAGRSVSGSPRQGAARMPGLPGRVDRLVLRLSAGPGGRILSPPIRLQIRAVGFGRHRRSDRPRRARGRRCRCGSAVSGPGRCVRCGPEAAAYRHGVRRIELRRHHAPERSGSGRLSRPIPLVRCQGAVVRGRGCRRSELVHRVQRPHRTLRALLRPLCRVPSPGWPPGGSSADCPMRCASAATRPTACIPGSAASPAPAASRPRRGSSISSTPSNWAAGRRTPIASTTTTPPASSPSNATTARFLCSSISPSTIFPGITDIVPICCPAG